MSFLNWWYQQSLSSTFSSQQCQPPCPLLDNIRVMVIFWRLRGNIIRTALCWIVWHNVHSLQHTYMSSSYRSNRLGLSHWDPYAVHRGGCLELYDCNIMERFWWVSSLISTNWFLSMLWHCWFGHLAGRNRPRNDLLCVEWDVKPYTLTHCECLPVIASCVSEVVVMWFTLCECLPVIASSISEVAVMWLCSVSGAHW